MIQDIHKKPKCRFTDCGNAVWGAKSLTCSRCDTRMACKVAGCNNESMFYINGPGMRPIIYGHDMHCRSCTTNDNTYITKCMDGAGGNCRQPIVRMGLCIEHFKCYYPQLCCQFCCKFPTKYKFCIDHQCKLCVDSIWCVQHIFINFADIIVGYLEVIPRDILRICLIYTK